MNDHSRCVFCRVTRRKSVHLKFFRFPKDEERCRQWLLACNLNSLLSVPSIDMYKKYRLCSQHFQESDYSSLRRERLRPTACPSKFENYISVSKLQERLKNKLAENGETSILIDSQSITEIAGLGDSEFSRATDVLECQNSVDDLLELSKTLKQEPNTSGNLYDSSGLSCTDCIEENETSLDESTNMSVKSLTPEHQQNFADQFQKKMVRHPEHKFLKEVTEKTNKIYERIMASNGQSKPRENRNQIAIVRLVQCDPQNVGKLISKSQHSFQTGFQKPHTPPCPRCQFERSENRDSRSEDEICEHCNKTVTYQSFRVCDCGCRPAGPGLQTPTFVPRMMTYGDNNFNVKKPGSSKVWGNPEILYLVKKREEE